MRPLQIVFVLAACSGPIWAQSEPPGVFHDTITGLTMRFPVELVVIGDAQKAIDEGHVAVFGSMQNEAKEHELASRCIKPLVLAELPKESSQKDKSSGGSATLFLFEFIASKECKAGFKYKDDEAIARGVAQTAIQLPGATPLSRPLWFDFGKQKLHASFSAFGLQNTSPDQPHALIAMAAMRYHGHILCWMMSAGQLNPSMT